MALHQWILMFSHWFPKQFVFRNYIPYLLQKLPGYNESLNFQQLAYGALMLNFFNINAHPFFIKKYTGSLIYKIYWTDTLFTLWFCENFIHAKCVQEILLPDCHKQKMYPTFEWKKVVLHLLKHTWLGKV